MMNGSSYFSLMFHKNKLKISAISKREYIIHIAMSKNYPSEFRFRSKLKIFLFILLCCTASTIWYTSEHLTQYLHNYTDEPTYHWPIQTEHHPKKSWNPSTYLHHALHGPRRCQSSPCYIIDIIADPYQPRLFLSMLGLPASDIPSATRGNVTQITMVDIRSGQEITMRQSRDLVNDTHSYALMVQTSDRYLITDCNLLKHNGSSMNAFFESMTYTCDFDYPIHQLSKKIRVDVLLAPLMLGASWGMGIHPSDYVNLNGIDTPFYIDGNHKGSSGLFNSVARKPSSLNTHRISENSTEYIPRASACLIGVNYASPQHREVIQYYISTGFEHIYLGLPIWPDTTLFNETWSLLKDFVMDGNLSIIVSEYAKDFIDPERFGNNFSYAPQGHKSSFLNTCLLAARAAGDDLVFVGDIDELIEYKYGNATTIGEAVMKQLSLRNMTLSQLCCMNLGAMGGFYYPDKAGYSNTARIKHKLAAVGNVSDSVATYGKSILNPRRVLRAGLHSAAYCESLMVPGLENVTRLSQIDDGNMFRPDTNDIRILHLTDSFKQRSQPWMINTANKGNQLSYFVRDYSSIVAMELERRDNHKFRP